jgi:hypothetical protein
MAASLADAMGQPSTTDAEPESEGGDSSCSGSGDSSRIVALAQLRVAPQRGGRCGHHALHNAILAATAATEGAPLRALAFICDLSRDVAFWRRYLEVSCANPGRCFA